MHRRHCLAWAAAPAILALPAVARAEPGVSDREVVIGQSIALQGGTLAYGVEAQAGIQAVLQPLNDSGGVHGRRLALRTLDDRNDARQAEAHATQLADDGVFMLFGSIEGGPSAAVAKVAEARRLPFVGPMAGAPTLRRPHLAMVFPVRAEHREEFRALVGWARRTGLSTVAFFHSDSEVGRAHLDNTRLACEEAGARLLYGLPVKGDVDDAALQAMVRRLQAEPVDCLFNHGSASPYGRLIKAARAAGVRTAFMGVNSGSTELARALGETGRGMVFSQVMPSPWQRRTALVRDYQQAFGAVHPGRAYSYASLEGFATARALVAGLQKAGPRLTRAGLLQALETMDLDLGGVPLRWRPGDHAGAHYVDLAMVARDGRFVQ